MNKENEQQPVSSLKAYDSIKRNGVDKNHRATVYNAILLCLATTEQEAVTAGDLPMHCELNYYQISKRMGDLVRDNKIFVSSETGGKSPSGKQCKQYKVCDPGHKGER